jgi:hypothetical protein
MSRSYYREMNWTPEEVTLLLFYRVQGLPFETIVELLHAKLTSLRTISSLQHKIRNLRCEHDLNDATTGRELDRHKTKASLFWHSPWQF